MELLDRMKPQGCTTHQLQASARHTAPSDETTRRVDGHRRSRATRSKRKAELRRDVIGTGAESEILPDQSRTLLPFLVRKVAPRRLVNPELANHSGTEVSSSAIAIARIDERAESPVPAIKIATSAKKNRNHAVKTDVEDRVVIVSDDSGERREAANAAPISAISARARNSKRFCAGF